MDSSDMQKVSPPQYFLMKVALVWCCMLWTHVVLASSWLWILGGKQNSVPNMWKVILANVPFPEFFYILDIYSLACPFSWCYVFHQEVPWQSLAHGPTVIPGLEKRCVGEIYHHYFGHYWIGFVHSCYLGYSHHLEVVRFSMFHLIAKYNLPHIWDRVLFNMPKFKIKNLQEKQESQAHTMKLVPATSRSICKGEHFLWVIYAKKKYFRRGHRIILTADGWVG